MRAFALLAYDGRSRYHPTQRRYCASEERIRSPSHIVYVRRAARSLFTFVCSFSLTSLLRAPVGGVFLFPALARRGGAPRRRRDGVGAIFAFFAAGAGAWGAADMDANAAAAAAADEPAAAGGAAVGATVTRTGASAPRRRRARA